MAQQNSQKILEEARRVLSVEAETLSTAAARLDQSFVDTVLALHSALKAGGKIVTSGVGKSGNVAQKVAATLTSTGSMAVFLHPTEAVHGDLGILGPKDVLLLFSHSGASQELLLMLPAARALCAGVCSILGNPKGTLSAHSDAVISSSISAEACSDNLAPTASSTLAMAIGDAIAMSLKSLAGFGPDHFARLHPGGSLGKRLLTKASDLMHTEIAMLSPDESMENIVVALTKYPHSGACVVDGTTASGKPRLAGVITEGDIRRAISRKEGFFQLRARDIMTKKPATAGADIKASDALELMEQRERQLSFLPIVDSEGGCLGALRIHDLILIGLG